MEVLRLFEKHLPGHAVTYCYDLWKNHPFTFVASRPRRTKLGDFRAEPGKGLTITVNSDLNPYAFLITYLHEVAHLLVYQRSRRFGQPHGPIWKKTFREVMQPVLHESVFPQNRIDSIKTLPDQSGSFDGRSPHAHPFVAGNGRATRRKTVAGGNAGRGDVSFFAERIHPGHETANPRRLYGEDYRIESIDLGACLGGKNGLDADWQVGCLESDGRWLPRHNRYRPYWPRDRG
jgi:hypothetical protein